MASRVQPYTCQLCNKSYSTPLAYEAHQTSYDHQHNARAKNMRSTMKSSATNTSIVGNKRKKPGDGLLGANIISDNSAASSLDGPGGERGFKPVGFAVATVATPAGNPTATTGDKEDEEGKEMGDKEDGYKVLNIPILWDDLDGLDDLVDLKTDRPREMEEFMGRLRDNERLISDEEYRKKIWKGIDAPWIKDKRGVDRETPERAIGLGA